jgi:hypothetical protein
MHISISWHYYLGTTHAFLNANYKLFYKRWTLLPTIHMLFSIQIIYFSTKDGLCYQQYTCFSQYKLYTFLQKMDFVTNNVTQNISYHQWYPKHKLSQKYGLCSAQYIYSLWTLFWVFHL